MLSRIIEVAWLVWAAGITAAGVRLWKRKPRSSYVPPPNAMSAVCPACGGKWNKWTAATQKEYHSDYGPDTVISTTYQRRACGECGYTEQRKVGELRERF